METWCRLSNRSPDFSIHRSQVDFWVSCVAGLPSDSKQTLITVGKNMFLPDAQARYPAFFLGDAISEINRSAAGQPGRLGTTFSAADYQALLSTVGQFLSDERRGVRRVLDIINTRKRKLSPVPSRRAKTWRGARCAGLYRYAHAAHERTAMEYARLLSGSALATALVLTSGCGTSPSSMNSSLCQNTASTSATATVNPAGCAVLARDTSACAAERQSRRTDRLLARFFVSGQADQTEHRGPSRIRRTA